MEMIWLLLLAVERSLLLQRLHQPPNQLQVMVTLVVFTHTLCSNKSIPYSLLYTTCTFRELTF